MMLRKPILYYSSDNSISSEEAGKNQQSANVQTNIKNVSVTTNEMDENTLREFKASLKAEMNTLKQNLKRMRKDMKDNNIQTNSQTTSGNGNGPQIQVQRGESTPLSGEALEKLLNDMKEMSLSLIKDFSEMKDDFINDLNVTVNVTVNEDEPAEDKDEDNK
ncbi:hypothetical protein [Bacillus sp. RO1]|uniref:hypothetical protein n=1 Tax=Bacillus sp. RO1 TaxID=2722703 RepID=UPI00145781BA|nr:hypothetical protein [Bacillus sp. RO1]NLP51093.1 hypothetical protein [Bacillus sp. RO1]